ncbi:hypothetical protein GOODEAATRI_009795 [Goodea atripinnis]|uniref:Uncharacterized protein n=1 Tax=Goodea atripinnis TaxID=208336 RepID=A0ABV0P358_9TELE
MKFDSIFESLGPVGGMLSGDKVKPVLLNSKLPVDILGRVWELSDLDRDGMLDRDEFSVAMFLVYRALEGESVPMSLPPPLVPPSKRKKPAVAPVVPLLPSPPSVKDSRSSHTGSKTLPHPPKPAPAPAPTPAAVPWVVSAAEKTKYDELFSKTDSDMDGLVSGAEVRDIFLKTGLPSATLARIWELCDIGDMGKLTREQFALALYLINLKLTKGLDPPQTLSLEMIPPSDRQNSKQNIANLAADFSAIKELDTLSNEIVELQSYIMSYDLHAICEGCLGPDHANLALTPQSTCPSCRRLPPEQKKRRLAIFSPLEGEFSVADQCSLDEALGIFSAGRESDDSAPETATDISTPFLGRRTRRQMPNQSKLRASRSQHPTDDLAGKFAPAHLTRRGPVWPRFPAVTAYLSGAAAEPLQLTAPVSTFTPIMRVESLTDQGFPPVPVLEPSLSADFGVRSARRVRRRPVPPSPSDQITARVTDRSHQCAAHVAAATNNTAFLAYSISKKAREMELPPEDVEEFCNFADTILNLCAASAVCSSRIAAWQTSLQRQMWLRLSSIPDDFKRELLEGPISSDGLFSPHFQSVLGQMQTSQEELERVRRHGSLSRSGFRSSHTTGRWRDRRDQRHQQRRFTAAVTAP